MSITTLQIVSHGLPTVAIVLGLCLPRMDGLKIIDAHDRDEAACTKGRYYVYDDLPKEWDDTSEEVKAPLSMKEEHHDDLLGDAFLSELNFGESIYKRLLHSECRTTDAGNADVFFIPILLKKKDNPEWKTACTNANLQNLKPHMKHLNKTTARQHFVVHNHGHSLRQECYGWWQAPYDKSFEHVSRFTTDNRTSQAENIRLISPIPYPTLVHAHKRMTNPPWELSFSRPNLIAYATNSSVHGMSKDVRSYLISACKQHDECHFIDTEAKPNYYALYSSAEFCLHPPGDTLAREGIIQSLQMGCIPVLFHKQQLGLWDWFWGSWKRDSSFFIDGDTLCAKSAEKQNKTEVIEALKRISPERRQEMRKAIAANAFKMQWAVQETPDGRDDAFDIIVQHLKKGEDGYHAMLAEDRVLKAFEDLQRHDPARIVFDKEESTDLLRMPVILEL